MSVILKPCDYNATFFLFSSGWGQKVFKYLVILVIAFVVEVICHEISIMNKEQSPDTDIRRFLKLGEGFSKLSKVVIKWASALFLQNKPVFSDVHLTAKTSDMLYLYQHWWRVMCSQGHQCFFAKNKLWECAYLLSGDWLNDMSWWA